MNVIYSADENTLKADRVQEMMKNHYHRYHDGQNIVKNQDEKDTKEKSWNKNLNDDQDLKERINRKFFEKIFRIVIFFILLKIYSNTLNEIAFILTIR